MTARRKLERMNDRARQKANEPLGIFLGNSTKGRQYGVSFDAEATIISIHWPTVEALAKECTAPDHAIPSGVQWARILIAVRDRTYVPIEAPVTTRMPGGA